MRARKAYPVHLVEDLEQLSRDLANSPKTTDDTEGANLELLKRAQRVFTEWFDCQEKEGS